MRRSPRSADPTRRAIVSRLAKGDATVNDLAAPFPMSLPGVSKHLKVLERSGLISRRRDAQFRPCHLEVEVLDGAFAWIAEHRRIWDERFDKLDAHLRDIQRGAGDATGDATERGRRGRGSSRAQGTAPGKARGKGKADDRTSSD